MYDFGTVLRIFRLVNDFTIVQVSEKTGLSSMCISNIERSLRKPKLDTLYKLSKAYDVSPSEISRICEAAQLNIWNFQRIMFEVLHYYDKNGKV